MSFRYNPFTGNFDRVEKASPDQEFELLADQGVFDLKKIVKLDRLLIFEGQAKSVRVPTKTGAKQITFIPDVPAGTTLNIYQL